MLPAEHALARTIRPEFERLSALGRVERLAAVGHLMRMCNIRQKGAKQNGFFEDADSAHVRMHAISWVSEIESMLRFELDLEVAGRADVLQVQFVRLRRMLASPDLDESVAEQLAIKIMQERELLESCKVVVSYFGWQDLHTVAALDVVDAEALSDQSFTLTSFLGRFRSRCACVRLELAFCPPQHWWTRFD
jgi:hypothetical protein